MSTTFKDGFGNTITIEGGGGGNGTVSDLGAYANNLHEKRWLCIGDSITAQNHSYRVSLTQNYGINMAAVPYGAYGNGVRASYGGGVDLCMYDRVKKAVGSVTVDVHIATIFLGTNDYASATPIGTITDDPTAQTEESFTFMGCYKGIIHYLFETYGPIPIVLLTPIQRSNGYNKNSAGHTLEDYRNAVLEIGKYYSIPVVDLYATAGMSLGHSNNIGNAYGDGLHPGAAFWKMAAMKVYYAMNEAIKSVSVIA